MIRETADAVRPRRLPTTDVSIRIHRDRGMLEVGDSEIHVFPRDVADPRPRQVRWTVVDPLLRDEMVLVFGRSLDWTGPTARRVRSLTLVEGVFPRPFVLPRQQPYAYSGLPDVLFPMGLAVVGWSFGAVLVRGDDTPWVGSSILRIARSRA